MSSNIQKYILYEQSLELYCKKIAWIPCFTIRK